MNVLLAHPGTQHAPRLAAELAARDCLHEYWTCLAWPEKGWADRLARRWPSVARLHTRVIPGVPAERLRTRPTLELRLHTELRLGAEPIAAFHRRNARFQAAIPEAALTRCSAAIGFDTSSWILARRCHAAGRSFFLDRTIGHPDALHRLLERHHHTFPEWTSPLPSRPVEVRAAEATEHALAHRIVVGGTFAQQTLADHGVAIDRIRVNPYGVDWPAFDRTDAGGPVGHRPFRFLFAGTVGLRKGVPFLLRAWEAAGLPDAELWLAGHIGPRIRPLIPALPGLRVLGHVPRAGMTALYAAADVFVVPSLFEGFSLALLEAVAAGLPVITTPNAGGTDFLPNPALGQLVAAGEVEPLVEALRQAHRERRSRHEVRRAAAPLQARHSWPAHGERWAAILRER